jgi:glycosyltransferase involved in cell wall biosynthesis
MSRIPSLVSNLPAMKKIIDEYQIGIAVSTDSSPQQIADAIKQLCQNKESFITNCESACRTLNFDAQKEKILSMVGS